MSDIDDLCQIIHRGIGLNFEDLAEEIIAAGFHRDRTIDTAEELDALAKDSVIMDDRSKEVWVKGSDGTWTPAGVDDIDDSHWIIEWAKSVTVLYEGARDE